MDIEGLNRSVCMDCRWCGKAEYKFHNQPGRMDYQCDIPIHRHQFGKVRGREDCKGFFMRAVLMEVA